LRARPYLDLLRSAARCLAGASTKSVGCQLLGALTVATPFAAHTGRDAI
jgi:hypothetical protein